MDMGWGEERCIHCLGVPNTQDADSVMTRGHVIPQSVGGKLYAFNECKRCNGRLGHAAEAALVGDPAVRSAAESVAKDIPDLIRQVRRRRVFMAQSETGLVVRAVAQEGGDFKILQTPQPDGSRTASDADIRAEIEKSLLRKGISARQVAEELRRLDEAPPDASLSVGGEFVVRKGTVTAFGLPPEDPIVPDVTILLIAYRYLAGCVGSLIYGTAFDPIRNAIRKGLLPQQGIWRVEPRWTRKSQPWHGLAIASAQPHVVAHVRLFGELVWLVHVEQIALSTGNLITYTIDLTDGDEQIGSD
jgi:hypothetical protein